ncbi:MAG: energy-coupling factor transporter transmembrane protein EcfT [Actinomycetota bacterium]|nr:energy-coupling factor transporter transmembrane protein EcfT [Actinomycetota bacterium]
MSEPEPAYGPLSLLAASLAPMVGAPAIHSAQHGALVVAALLVLALFVVRDWSSTLRRLGVGSLAAASVGVSTWLYGGRELDEAVGAVSRILYLILPACVLTPFLDPRRLGDHLGQRLRLPARVVVTATVALERLEDLGRQWEQIGRARRARGVGADGGLVNRTRVSASMALSLLISTMRMSGAMSLAMDARGFATAQHRTWAEPAPWQRRDTLVLAGGVLIAVLPWLLLAPAIRPVAGLG